MVSTMDRHRPNLLFAFADDFGRYASCYRSLPGASPLCALVETPAIDRVAREGALVTQALVPAPSCTPCRSAVLSGRSFWRCGLGAILQGAIWDRRIPSWPLLLEEAGWSIGFSDKVWAPGVPQDDPYGGLGRRWQVAGSRFGRFSQHATAEAGLPGGVAAAKQRLYQEVRGNFSAFLDARTAGTPFAYWWGPTNTHRDWERGSGRQLWGLDPEALRGRLPGFLPDVPAIREDVADYLGECQAFDAGVGVLLDELARRGELDRTLVVVSGDHGIPGIPRAKCNLYGIGCEVALAFRLPGAIAPGRVLDGLADLMDLAPTFLEAAGVPPPPGLDGRSLWPWLRGERAEPPRDAVVCGRERHVADARAGGLPYPQRALRTRDHLYIRNYAPERWPMGDPRGLDDPACPAPAWEALAGDTRCAYPDLDASPTKAWMVQHRGEEPVRDAFALGFGLRPAEELYDLRADPDQLRNLAGDPAHAALRRTLAERLDAELRDRGDPRALPGPCRFERSPFTDPGDGGGAVASRLAAAWAMGAAR